MSLNKSQLMAVDHFNGPLLVISGPGSGKTTVIVNRIFNLIDKYKVNPSEILVLTYTRAAANEMRERYFRMFDGEDEITFGTFHSVFYAILREENVDDINVIPESMKYKIIGNILYEKKLYDNMSTESIRSIINEISYIKNTLVNRKEYNPSSLETKIFYEIEKEYEKNMLDMNMLDFDDMLTRCYEMFQSDARILRKYQERYKYILIDEFQDINKLQYNLVRLLTKTNKNVFVVGDDDQSIYAFRGAMNSLMHDFEKEFNADKILLDTNYRCPKEILKLSSIVVKDTKGRFDKEIKGTKEIKESVEFTAFASYKDESIYIANTINKLLDEGVDARNIGVLYRTATSVRNLVTVMESKGIAYEMRDKLDSIYATQICEDICAYLRIATLREVTRADFLKVMNKPVRYIKRELVKRELFRFESLFADEIVRNNRKLHDSLYDMYCDMRLMGKMSAYGAISYLRKKVGYDKYLNDMCARKNISEDESLEVIEQLQLDAYEYVSIEDWLCHVETELRKAMDGIRNNNNGNSGSDDIKKTKNQVKGKVRVMSIHQSKGLEFDTVFIPAVNEGIIPHKRAKTREAKDEERRIFYVALTRASRKLYITYSFERVGKSTKISGFLEEIRKSNREYNIVLDRENYSSSSSTISSYSCESSHSSKASATISYSSSLSMLARSGVPSSDSE